MPVDVRKRSPSQAHHALVLLSTIFKWARATGYVDVNPAEGQPFYHRSPARERYLSEREIAVFWHGLEVDPYLMPTTRICLRLLLLTGARRDDWAEAPTSELQDGCLVRARRTVQGEAHPQNSAWSYGARASRCGTSDRSILTLAVSEPWRIRIEVKVWAHECQHHHGVDGATDGPAANPSCNTAYSTAYGWIPSRSHGLQPRGDRLGTWP